MAAFSRQHYALTAGATIRLTRTLLAGVTILGIGFGLGSLTGNVDRFSQRDFPCAEDEALVYAPQFGPDRVGCLHVENGELAPEVWERQIH